MKGYYRDKIKIYLTTVEVSTGLNLAEFSDLVSRDRRIPNWQSTSGVLSWDEQQNLMGDDEKIHGKISGAKIWHPNQLFENAFGVALVPSGYVDRWAARPSSRFDYGFQGADDDRAVLVSGKYTTYTTGSSNKNRMLVLSSSTTKGEAETRVGLENFIAATGLKEIDFLLCETELIDKNLSNLARGLTAKDFHKYCFYTYAAVLNEGCGDRVRYTEGMV